MATDSNVATPFKLVLINYMGPGTRTLSAVISSLPHPFPAPVVVAHQLDPDEEEALRAEAVANRCPLPICRITGPQHLEEGVVHLVSGEQRLEIEDHAIVPGTGPERTGPEKGEHEEGSAPRRFMDLLLGRGEAISRGSVIAVLLWGKRSYRIFGRGRDMGGAVVTLDGAHFPLGLEVSEVDPEPRRLGPILHALLLSRRDRLETGGEEPPSEESRPAAREAEALRETTESSREKLHAVLVGVTEGVCVVDRAGRLVQTNEVYQQMFLTGGIEAEDEEGRALPPGQTPQGRAARGETFRMEFAVPTADRSGRRYFEASGYPLRESRGPAGEAGVVVIREVTQRRLQRLRERFLAMAAHELRTPLVPVMGYLELLLKSLSGEGGDAQLREYAAIALSQVQRLAGLVNELVDRARIESGKFSMSRELVDLVPLCERCLKLIRAMAPARAVDGRLEPGPVMVRGDAARLEQVLMNLLLNALTHAPAGSIEVRLRCVEGEAEVQVEDQGPGIPAADLPEIFSSFYQVSPANRPGRGLGMGLFIAREIVAGHGGRIAADSIEGRGTTFTVNLPLSAGA